MKIGGFQKFSLLDYPGKLSAIVFTQGCNFRCPYCHNPELVDESRYQKPIDTEYVLRFLYRRRRKLSAVVVTGGEPTLQEDLIPFLKLLKAMRYYVKLDTNGTKPGVLKQITMLNLVDYIALDLKAPMALYNAVTRSDMDIADLAKSINIIRGSGIAYEFRTTFFDKLLSWRDLNEIRNLLLPGEKYYIQKCQYGNNLEEFPKTNLSPSLDESQACQELISWGRSHQVQIAIR